MDHDLLIWAAGFFDGEGCISISKPINKKTRQDGTQYVHTGYQLQAIVAQRDRRPMEVLMGLFGGSITTQQIHGSTYWYLRLHGPKALAMLERLLPFLILKQGQADLAIRFQRYYDSSRKTHRGMGRSPEEQSILDGFYQQSKLFNLRFKEKDWTAQQLPN